VKIDEMRSSRRGTEKAVFEVYSVEYRSPKQAGRNFHQIQRGSMPTIKIQGIILRRENFREYDRIFTIYARDLGKISCIASGIRKVKSKQAGHMEPFTCSELMLAHGRSGILRLATSVSVHDYPRIRCSVAKIMVANQCLELVDASTSEGHPDRIVYDMLLSMFAVLEEMQALPYEKGLFLVRSYGLKLLSYLGYQPELLMCLVCQRKIENTEVIFHTLQGGLIETRCASEKYDPYAHVLPPAVIITLKLVLEQNFSQLASLRLSRKHILFFSTIVLAFLHAHLENPRCNDGLPHLLHSLEHIRYFLFPSWASP